MTDNSGYGTSNIANSVAGSGSADGQKRWDLARCKSAYGDYLSRKRDEIEERKISRRYRHGAQWTAAQVKALNRRKQPVVTFDHIGPKINGIVGALERLRQDPKAYPRSPQHQEGADLATAVLRYVCDEQQWKAKSALVAEDAAVDGIGCMELELEPGDKTDGQSENGQPDYDIAFYPVRDGFFYDPRSMDLDFADAVYMGRGKWVDEETLRQLDPDLSSGEGGGSELSEDTDRDNKWFYSTSTRKMFRLVDLWYRVEGQWMWALFTGSRLLKDGDSPWKDEKKRSTCKFVAFSFSVDHDGDRYGAVRLLKGPQDEVNARHSKGLHELNSRRIIATKTQIATGDVERTRREAARPDGIVLVNPDPNGQEIRFDDAAKQANVMGQFEMLQFAQSQIENYGPGAKAIGDEGVKAESGRAIQLRQQAGFAELGPFFGGWKGWKIRFYRAVFCGIQAHWTGERWVRVTDNQDVVQFVQINGVQMDPMTGQPQMVNAIGSLDVDIILDEGADAITSMQDTYETISQALPAVAGLISPQVAQAALSVLIETSPLPESAKKQFRDAGKAPPPPDPEMVKAQADAQRGQAELQLQAQKQQGELAAKREMAQVDAEIETFKAQKEMEIEVFKAKAKIDLERQMGQMKMAQAAETADQERQLAREGFAHDRQIAQDEAATKIEVTSAVADNQMKIAKRKASQPTASK